MMKTKTTKPIGIEQKLYAEYCESLKNHGMEARSQEEWIKLYRETQLRLRREHDAKGTNHPTT